MPDTLPNPGFTVHELCKRWQMGDDKVRSFIRRCEVLAIYITSDLSGRPQLRFRPEAPCDPKAPAGAQAVDCAEGDHL
jgi:hypothetical protein